MQPLDFVGLRVGLDGAVQVDVITLRDAHGVDVLAEAKLNLWRIWKEDKN